jgi:uncharacterized protein (TIGR00645 family)
MHSAIDKAMLASRHILVVFYLGLAVALALYAVRFLGKVWVFARDLFTLEESEDLLALLHLVDSALVASMVVMVAISSYDSLVSRLKEDAARERMHWVGGLDTGDLKLKLATSIVAISSIQLLQVFLKPGSYDDNQTFWSLVIHGVFLAGALCLGVLEWMTHLPSEPGREKHAAGEVPAPHDGAERE